MATGTITENHAFQSMGLSFTGAQTKSLTVTDFTELLVEVRINNTENKAVFTIPRCILSSTTDYIRQGAYLSGGATQYVAISVSLTTIGLNSAYLFDVNYTSGSLVKVYYR